MFDQRPVFGDLFLHLAFMVMEGQQWSAQPDIWIQRLDQLLLLLLHPYTYAQTADILKTRHKKEVTKE